MRQTFLGVVTLVAVAVLSFAGLVGCAAPDEPAAATLPPVHGQVLPNSIVFGEFIAHRSPKNHTLTFERVRSPQGYGANLEPQSLDQLPIISDGVSGSGPAGTVELVSANCVDNYPSVQTFQCDVTLRHFYSRSFANVFAQVTAITDSSGNNLANHEATNSDSSQYGLSAALGLWEYTADASTNPGVLAQSPNNAGTRTWVFANPDDADDNVSIVVYGSLGFANYGFDFPNASYVDACSGGTQSISQQITATLPFDFTLFNTNTTTVKFTPRNGQMVVANTMLTGLTTPVSLPSGSAPSPVVFPFWDALKYSTGIGHTGKMCYQTVGSAPNRQFLIEWRNMDFASGVGQGSVLDFEAVLYEGTGELDVVYNSMQGTANSNGRENGALAMVGMQDETHTNWQGEFKTQDFGTGSAWAFIPSPF
jgi:hypothetical protein